MTDGEGIEFPPLDYAVHSVCISQIHCPRLYTCLSPQHPLSHRFLCPRHLSPNAFTLHSPPSPLPSSPPHPAQASLIQSPCITRHTGGCIIWMSIGNFAKWGIPFLMGTFPFGHTRESRGARPETAHLLREAW